MKRELMLCYSKKLSQSTVSESLNHFDLGFDEY